MYTTDSELSTLKADYDRDGFVLLPGFLSAAEVSELRARAMPLAAGLMKAERPRAEFRNVLKSLHRHDAWFEDQLNAGKHLPLLRCLLEGEVVGVSAAWFDRPKGAAEGIKPHIDAVGGRWTPTMGATIWIALDFVNVGNGCLHYLRGSQARQHSGALWVSDIDTASDDVFAAELAPGDAVIHSAVTVHWSGGNTTGAPRRAVSYFYHSAQAQMTMKRVEEA